MQQVTGWLTEDEKFFARREEAALYEAGKYLEASLIAFAGPKANYERFMYIVNNLRQEIGSYLNAAQALEDYENRAEEDEGNVVASEGDVGGEGADPNPPDLGIGPNDEANEQQPAGGPGAVSDMGTRSLAEEIRNLGSGNGAGSRRVDAQDFFSREDLAAMAPPEAGEARHGDGAASIWDEVDTRLANRERALQGPARSPSESVLLDIARHGMARQPNRRHENDG